MHTKHSGVKYKINKIKRKCNKKNGKNYRMEAHR